jgi:uncharacterized protein with NRDE domain
MLCKFSYRCHFRHFSRTMCSVLCTNRDEYVKRPTKGAHFHSFDKEIGSDHQQGSVLSGRDLLAGGTWLGISESGRIGLL